MNFNICWFQKLFYLCSMKYLILPLLVLLSCKKEGGIAARNDDLIHGKWTYESTLIKEFQNGVTINAVNQSSGWWGKVGGEIEFGQDGKIYLDKKLSYTYTVKQDSIILGSTGICPSYKIKTLSDSYLVLMHTEIVTSNYYTEEYTTLTR